MWDKTNDNHPKCLLNASKRELKIPAKPWITNGIRSSIKIRDKLLRKFIKTKDEVLKDELYAAYKTLRNKIVSLTMAGKKLHFQQYFTGNCKDIRVLLRMLLISTTSILPSFGKKH